jgi:hypothetical protein
MLFINMVCLTVALAPSETVNQNWIFLGLIQINKSYLLSFDRYDHMNAVLKVAILGPPVRLFQRWPPTGRRMVGVKRGIGYAIQNESHFWDILVSRCRIGHRHMARDGHGLPKVLFRPVMPYLSMPCRWATCETALLHFQGWPACKAGGLGPSSNPLDTPLRTPMKSVITWGQPDVIFRISRIRISVRNEKFFG